MPTTLTQCEGDVLEHVARMIADHHPDLKKARIKVDLLFAANPDGPAVLLHGYVCAAVVRKVSYKNRVMGRGDIEIVIDQEWWNDATRRQRDALIDHELTHVEVVYDKRTGAMKRDRADRPRLVMRLHDWEMGGFEEVAKRWGKDAAEVKVARDFKAKFGQYCFDFAGGEKRRQDQEGEEEQ